MKKKGKLGGGNKKRSEKTHGKNQRKITKQKVKLVTKKKNLNNRG